MDSEDQSNPRRPGRLQHDGVTAEERDQPYPTDPALLDLERAARQAQPEQLALLVPTAGGELAPLLGGLPPLAATSSLDLARAWYRIHLEKTRRPSNTIESYCYDLMKLEERTGPVPINTIRQPDIAEFLGLATNRSTRKRRLTSVRRFFRYLIDDAQVLKNDPSEGFFPHQIALRLPVPLFQSEQEDLIVAARNDEPWSLVAIWLMLKLGLTRGELLALRREHIDLSDPAAPVVYVAYDDAARQGKERRLGGDAEFAGIYRNFLEEREPADILFPVGFQAVNGMVERVRRAAAIARQVTPQTLRHTFAVEAARAGANTDDLIALLGLADDPRNRASVDRYIRLAEPPLVGPGSGRATPGEVEQAQGE